MRPYPRRAAAAAGLALGLLALGPATAGTGRSAPAPMCGSYDELRVMLDRRFGERPASSGLADDGTVMQVFASAGAGTWTMVSIDPSGKACVLATGEGWQPEAGAHQGEPA